MDPNENHWTAYERWDRSSTDGTDAGIGSRSGSSRLGELDPEWQEQEADLFLYAAYVDSGHRLQDVLPVRDARRRDAADRRATTRPGRSRPDGP